MTTTADSLTEYELQQDQIRKLLKQIECAIETHDHNAGGQPGGHTDRHVEELSKIVKTLTGVRDTLNGKGK